MRQCYYATHTTVYLKVCFTQGIFFSSKNMWITQKLLNWITWVNRTSYFPPLIIDFQSVMANNNLWSILGVRTKKTNKRRIKHGLWSWRDVNHIKNNHFHRDISRRILTNTCFICPSFLVWLRSWHCKATAIWTVWRLFAVDLVMGAL